MLVRRTNLCGIVLSVALANTPTSAQTCAPEDLLALPKSLATGFEPRAIVAADLERDGDIDYAVVNGVAPVGGIDVFFNDGTGRFATGPKIIGSDRVLGMAAGDLDNDGDIDVVTVNGSDDSISIYRNDGMGTLPFLYRYRLALGRSRWSCPISMVTTTQILPS